MQEQQTCQILLEIFYEPQVQDNMMKLISGQVYSLPKDCKLPVIFQNIDEHKFGENVLIYRESEKEAEYYRLSITCPAWASYCQGNPNDLAVGEHIPIHYKSTNVGYRQERDPDEIVQGIITIIETKSCLVVTNKNLHVMSFGEYNVEPEPFVANS